MFQNALSSFTQHIQRDAKALIGLLCSCHRLKQQVHGGTAVEGRTDSGGLALDLRAGVGVALASAGVDDRTDVDVCTYASSDYFSHRRDGVTGRQALIVRRPR